MRLHGITLRDRFPALDGLRAVGALAVMTTHVGFSSGASLNGPYAGFLARLDIGVALFFVVSGFLLYRPHAVARLTDTPPPPVGSYGWHRLLRIVPALWIAVALAAVTVPHVATVGIRQYLAHATLTQVYLENHQVAGLTQLWSLATEGAFYLALPLMGWLLSRGAGRGRGWTIRTLLLLSVLCAAGPAWMAWAAASGHPLRGLWLPGYLGWFSIGMMLAVWNTGVSTGALVTPRVNELARHPWMCWGAAAAILTLLTTPVAGPLGLAPISAGAAFTKSFCYGLIACLVVFPAVAARGATEDAGATDALGRGVWTFAGSISYGFFLYHVMVLNWVERAIGHRPFTGDFAVLFAGTLAVTTVLATLSYRLVERPLMRRGRHNRAFDVRTASSLDAVHADQSTARANAPASRP
jgi:peptidoglycan/LPS O-acetylase OafA/YrhL